MPTQMLQRATMANIAAGDSMVRVTIHFLFDFAMPGGGILRRLSAEAPIRSQDILLFPPSVCIRRSFAQHLTRIKVTPHLQQVELIQIDYKV